MTSTPQDSTKSPAHPQNPTEPDTQAHVTRDPASFWFRAICWWLITLAITAIGFGLYKQYQNTDFATLGPVGDYFGGMLNPIIGLLTILLVYSSWTLQNKQADDNRKQLFINQQEHHRSQTEDVLRSIYGAHDETVSRLLAQVKETYFSDTHFKVRLEKAMPRREAGLTKLLDHIKKQWNEDGWAKDSSVEKLLIDLQRNTVMMDEITRELLGKTDLPALKTYWVMQTWQRLKECQQMEVLPKHIEALWAVLAESHIDPTHRNLF